MDAVPSVHLQSLLCRCTYVMHTALPFSFRHALSLLPCSNTRQMSTPRCGSTSFRCLSFSIAPAYSA